MSAEQLAYPRCPLCSWPATDCDCHDTLDALRAAGYVVAKRDHLTTHIAAAIRAEALIARTPGDMFVRARKTADQGIQSAEDYA